jgi:diguanylate cyclase (GGDEF)-like protein
MVASALTLASSAVLAFAACAFAATAWAVVRALRLSARPGLGIEPNDVRYVLETLKRAEHERDVLSESLAAARDAVSRQKQFGHIAARLDLDSVLEAAFESAREVLDVDAAAISLFQPHGEPIVATFGLADMAEQRLPLHEPLGGSGALAATYDHIGVHGSPGTEAICAALTLNLADHDEEPLGMLSLYWRRSRPSLETRDVELAEELAQAIGAPLANGIRYRTVAHKADLDGLTQLRHNAAFRTALAAEVARAHRYERRLALLVVDVDDFKAINDRSGHLVGDAILAEFAAHLSSLVRVADVPGRIGGDEFAVALPESSASDAQRLFERLQAAARENTSFSGVRISFSGGIAELRPAEDAETFFGRADNALRDAKSGGKNVAVPTLSRPAEPRRAREPSGPT